MGPHKKLSKICLWVFECLLQTHKSTVICREDRGSGYSRSGRCGVWHSPFEEGSHCHHYPTIVWPQAKLQGGNTAPPINRKLDYRLLSMNPAHQCKTQIPPQPVPPIWKLQEVSYPYLSEDRQNENHNHRKLSKLFTWITALSNSMKLWAMPCRATQDRQVTVEFWWNVVNWRREWQTTSVFLPWESMNMKRQKDITLKDC